MVDRLEELLAMMESEDEDEDREDGPTLTERTAPAAYARWPEVGEGRPDGPVELSAGETAEDDPEGPVWTAEVGVAARRRERTEELGEAVEVLRRLDAGAAETARERQSAETADRLAAAVRQESGSGLEGLYRQVAQAVRPAAPQAAPVEQAGRTVRAEEPGRTAALTVDELDRAVRRDSRRYDGGMSIF